MVATGTDTRAMTCHARLCHAKSRQSGSSLRRRLRTLQPPGAICPQARHRRSLSLRLAAKRLRRPILQRHGLDPHDLDTVYVVSETGQLTARSDAVIFILHELGGFWCAIAVVLRIFPKSLRDWGYAVVARHRYRIFGKYESCPLPEKKYQDRFLDA